MGEHTATLYAKDAAGNKSNVYTVTVKVSAKVNPPDSGSTDSGNNSSSADKGCSSAVNVIPFGMSLLALAAVYTVIRKRKEA